MKGGVRHRPRARAITGYMGGERGVVEKTRRRATTTYKAGDDGVLVQVAALRSMRLYTHSRLPYKAGQRENALSFIHSRYAQFPV